MANLSETWLTCHNNIAKSIALMYVQQAQAQAAYAYVVASHDVPTEVDLLYPMIDAYNPYTDESRIGLFKPVVEYLIELARNGFVAEYNSVYAKITGQFVESLTLNEFLGLKGYKISQVILDVLSYTENYSIEYPQQSGDNLSNLHGVTQDAQQTQIKLIPELYVNPQNIYTEGYWEFNTSVSNTGCIGNFYDFILEVATDVAFTNILQTLDTRTSVIGWSYETAEDTEGNIYYDFFPEGGLYKEYIGRKVRFTSMPSIIDTTNMGRGDSYYTRITRIVDDAVCDVVIDEDVVYT